MSRWEKVRLGDVTSLLSGFAFKSNLFNEENKGIPIIRIRDLNKNNISTFFSGEYSKQYLIKKGELLISMDGMFKVSEWNGPDALLNQRVCKIIADEKQLITKYLFYFLPNQLKKIEDSTSFVTVKHLSIKDINDININLPPLEIQKQIAHTLDTISELISLYKKQLLELDNLIKSQFYDMFGDPVRNEKRLKVEKLGKLGTLERGISKHRPRNDEILLGGIYPLIQTGDVANSDLYITSYKSTYSKYGLRQSKLWEKGVLCITIAANIVKTAILGIEACFPDSIVGFKPCEDINIFFIHYWFSFFQKIIEEQAPQSAQKNINLKVLNNLSIIVPELPLQNKFATIVEKIEEQKSIVNKGFYESQHLFDSLMSRYFD